MSIRFEEHPLFSMDNIYRAYRRCRRRKRRTVNAMRFEANLEENIVSLHEELSAGTYRPGRCMAFLVEKPKKREIFAADFRDRVVHHILVSHLEVRWERRFIYDSYACRKGKGTHAGVKRVRSFTRKATANTTRRAWHLQIDIKGYFVALNRDILYRRISRGEKDPAVLWLLRRVIFHEPTENCFLRGASRGDFESLPCHKTLFKSRPRCGLPIGNLTSQFFANVYLDALDQYVKHELKIKYYVRYCDDMVFLSEDREKLLVWERRIEKFIKERLLLELNSSMRKLRPVSGGIDFLGYVIRPDYLLVRRRVVNNCREKLDELEKNITTKEGDLKLLDYSSDIIYKAKSAFSSYLAHFDIASSFRLKEAIKERYSFAGDIEENFSLISPRRRRFYSLRAQQGFFSGRLRRPSYKQAPDGQLCFDFGRIIIFFQVGDFYTLPGDDKKTAAAIPGFNIKDRNVGFPLSSELKYASLACRRGYSVYVIRERRNEGLFEWPPPRAVARKYLPGITE